MVCLRPVSLYTGKNTAQKQHCLLVTGNLLFNIDSRLASIVAFLDLSAVFDTLDHQILLKRLSITYRSHAKALQWFSSSLSDRQQSVTIESIFKICSTSVWSSPGVCTGPQSVHPVHSAPL